MMAPEADTVRCRCGWYQTYYRDSARGLSAGARAHRGRTAHWIWHRRRGDGRPVAHVHDGTASCDDCLPTCAPAAVRP